MRNVIYPAILAETREEFCAKIERASHFAEGVQIDVMDGEFVPATTFQDVDRIAACKPGGLFYEIHLMVKNPESHIRAWEKVADSYILHIRSLSDPGALIANVHAMKKEVGLAISPDVDVKEIEPYCKDINMVLVMTVVPGKDGQAYLSDMEKKITYLRRKHPTLPIEVDGGINTHTIVRAKNAGANIFTVGSALWGKDDGKAAHETYVHLQKLIS